MRNLTASIIAIGMCFAATGVSAEQTDLCQVSGPIKTIYGKDGPLPGCGKGDTAHFQIDHTLVAPAAVVGRYCDMRDEIFVDRTPYALTHIVCTYHWKWAKSTEIEVHPDHKKTGQQ